MSQNPLVLESLNKKEINLKFSVAMPCHGIFIRFARNHSSRMIYYNLCVSMEVFNMHWLMAINVQLENSKYGFNQPLFDV